MFNKVLFCGVAAMALIAGLGGTALPADFPAPGGADTSYSDNQNVDPPNRVGRLSFMAGTVSFHAADQDQWSPATLNFPVTTGDSFWTQPDARAEIEIGAAEVRLDQSSEVDVVRLDDSGTQIQVAQGNVNISFATQPEAGFQVLTPRGKVIFTQPGRYHIDAGQMNGDQPSDQVLVTVLQGEARFDAANGSHAIAVGQTLTASGQPVNFTVGQALQVTAFDQWAQSRDPKPAAAGAPAVGSSITWNGPAPAASPSLQYVSPDTTGYQDLDTYGSWNTTADYGAVWYPSSVGADWAPYRYGHWAYVAPWGWTWIDDAPWGFAPFHYGRWAFIDGRWGWCPGEFARRPVYAPALVAFIGDDDFSIGVSIGFGERHVGWVPLAPHEAFRPYYHASPTYIRNVNITTVNNTVINNITNVTNVTNVNDGAVTAASFRNARGATVVREAAFTGAAPVERATIAVAGDELAKARVENRLDRFRPSAAAKAGVSVAAAAYPTAAKIGTPDSAAAQTVPKSPGPAFNRNGDRTRGFARNAGTAPAATGNAKTDVAPLAATPGAPGPAIVHRGNESRRANENTAASPAPVQTDRAAQSDHGTAPANPAATNATAGAPGPVIVHRNNAPGGNTNPFNRDNGNAARANEPAGATGPAIVQHGNATGTANAESSGNRNVRGGAQVNTNASAAPGPGIVQGHGQTGTANSDAPSRRDAINAARVEPSAGPQPSIPGPAIVHVNPAPRTVVPTERSVPENRAAPVQAQAQRTMPGPSVVQQNAVPRAMTPTANVLHTNRTSPGEMRRSTPPGPAVVQQAPQRVAPAIEAPAHNQPAEVRRDVPSNPTFGAAQTQRQAPQIRQAETPHGGPAAGAAQDANGRAQAEQQARRNAPNAPKNTQPNNDPRQNVN